MTMQKFKSTSFIAKKIILVTTALVLLALTACGGAGTTNSEDNAEQNVDNTSQPDTDTTTPPVDSPNTDDTSTPPNTDSSSDFLIESYAPQDGANERSLATEITINFNKPIIASTLSENKFSLSANGTNVAFTFTSENNSAISLAPNALLSPNTTYTVAINNGLMSEDGDEFDASAWSFTTTGNLGATAQSTIDLCMSDDDIDMLDAVNNVRATGYVCASGSKPATTPLIWSCVIAEAADRHSNDMASNNFHSHTGSDGSNHAQRMVEAGFPSNRASGENIAAGYTTVSAAMEAWLSSPTGHCDNIMNANYTEFGSSRVIAPAGTTTYGTYWTQNFGRP